jgi:hypothetical protein
MDLMLGLKKKERKKENNLKKKVAGPARASRRSIWPASNDNPAIYIYSNMHLEVSWESAAKPPHVLYLCVVGGPWLGLAEQQAVSISWKALHFW